MNEDSESDSDPGGLPSRDAAHRILIILLWTAFIGMSIGFTAVSIEPFEDTDLMAVFLLTGGVTMVVSYHYIYRSLRKLRSEANAQLEQMEIDILLRVNAEES